MIRGVLAATLLLALRAGAKDAGATTPPAPAPITITFAGDVTLGYHYEEYFDEQVAKGRSRDEMFAHGFARVKGPAHEGSDLFVVNLECPFTTSDQKIPKNFNFRARPEFVQSLQAGGVDAVSIANNHMMDYGLEGLLETQNVLREAHIPAFGAGGPGDQAREPAIVEVKGVKVAFLGYFFLGKRNIEPASVISTEKTPGVAGHFSDEREMRMMVYADIAAAKKRADLVIPFFHWGREGMHVPEQYQVDLAHAAIDAGAAAVIGSHPHVLQGMELYKGAPILYSLGNFVFGGNWNPADKETAMVQLTFSPGGYLRAKIIPAHSDRFPEVPVQPYPVEGDKAQSVLRHLAEYSAGFGQMLPELASYAVKPGKDGKDAGR